MKDRVSRYPGRTKMTRGDGSVEYVTLERADEPQVVGDALNAANLLPDAVASALGLTMSNPQVKDAFNRLAKTAPVTGVYTGTIPNSFTTGSKTVTLGFRPQILIIAPKQHYGIEGIQQFSISVPGYTSGRVVLTSTGFTVSDDLNRAPDCSYGNVTFFGQAMNPYRYIAWR